MQKCLKIGSSLKQAKKPSALFRPLADARISWEQLKSLVVGRDGDSEKQLLKASVTADATTVRLQLAQQKI